MARILRPPSVIERTGLKRSSLYAEMAAGVFPRPVKLGPRAAGWVEYEVDRLIEARIAGVDDAALRRLVKRLVEARASLAQAA